ncbi:hypothetical protein B0H19DRAFT_129275 [Mycena capillaripes]|nr:hypothetical protein B0H19DRAFT_129275 [Mycena capillaripes]
MLKGIVKWPRKRPREPGRTGSPIAPELSPSTGTRKRFRLFKKQVPPQGQDVSLVQSVSRAHGQRRASALNVAIPATEILLLACDAPVVSVMKPFVGSAHSACQKLQTARDNKDAMGELELEAISIGKIVDDIAKARGRDSPELGRITQILDEIAGFLSHTSKKRNWRVWLSADKDKDQIKNLQARLTTGFNVLSAATNLSISDEIKHLEIRPDSQSPVEPINKITPMNLPSELIKIFQRTDTSIRIAIFS